MPAITPITAPERVPVIISGMKYTASAAVPITKHAAATCPALCINAPITLTPTLPKGVRFFAISIAIRLTIAPVAL